MKRRVVLFLLVISLLLSMQVLAEDNSIELGLSYYNQGELDKAKVEFKEALKYPENRVRAYSNLALIAKKEGEVDKAVTYYQQALRLNSNSVANHLSLGDLYLKQKKYQKAIKEYSIAQKLTSNFLPKQKYWLETGLTGIRLRS